MYYILPSFIKNLVKNSRWKSEAVRETKNENEEKRKNRIAHLDVTPEKAKMNVAIVHTK